MGKSQLLSKTNYGIYVCKKNNRRVVFWQENGNQRRMYYSHWLWEKTNGPIPEGFIIHHKDGDSLNDSLENYELLQFGQHSKIHNTKDEFSRECGKWSTYIKECIRREAKKYANRHIDLLDRFRSLEGNCMSEKLNNIYEKHGINQHQLSLLSGIDRGYLCRVGAGKQKLGYKSLIKLFKTIDALESKQIIPKDKTKPKYNPKLIGKTTVLEITRRKLKINRKKLSRLSGVAYGTIQEIEKKGYIAYKDSTLRKLALGLGVNEAEYDQWLEERQLDLF